MGALTSAQTWGNLIIESYSVSVWGSLVSYQRRGTVQSEATPGVGIGCSGASSEQPLLEGPQ
eukprot:9429856-Heterocapsa_arctica.AAC.1